MPSFLFKFFVRFCKLSSFLLKRQLLDIGVCDKKNIACGSRFIATYIFGSTTFSSRIYVRLFADNLLFVDSLGALFSSAF